MSTELAQDYLNLYNRLPKGRFKFAYSAEAAMDARALGQNARLCEFGGFELLVDDLLMMGILEACGAIKTISEDIVLDNESYTVLREMEIEIFAELKDARPTRN